MAALTCERRHFLSSDFVAKVINDSDEEVSCTVTGWMYRNSIPLEPNYFWVKPQSVVQIPIRAPLRLPHPLRTVALHMQNTALHATAEAEVPTPPALRLATLLASLASFALAGFIAWHAATAVISAYALPARVVAGDRVVASYAFSGIGTGEYEVTSDGVQVAGGVLADRGGTFSFPTAKSPGFYHVTLSVVGPFGTVRRQLLTQAIAFDPAGSLSIGALQPEPSVVRSGERITVRYQSDAPHGSVTLYDASNIALQHIAYSAGGVSTLTAPEVDLPTQYRVELVVSRGDTTARASAGLLVLPKDGSADAPPAGILTADQLFHVKSSVASASTFAVRLLQHPDGLRLTLEDSTGTALFAQSVSADEPLVYFQAPNVSHDSSYVIVASFSSGNVDQVLLQHILVRVR